MKVKSRKLMRKELRLAKKKRKHDYYVNKPKAKQKFQKSKISHQNQKNISYMKKKSAFSNHEVSRVFEEDATNLLKESIVKSKKLMKKKIQQFKTPQERLEFEREKEKKKVEKLNKDIERERIKMLKNDNLLEDKEIKKLEKQMKLRKGRSKAFTLDGLDCIL